MLGTATEETHTLSPQKQGRQFIETKVSSTRSPITSIDSGHGDAPLGERNPHRRMG
jgi:hypothetical protein